MSTVRNLQVGSFERTLTTRAHQKQKRKRALVAGLMLTSMVDMFSLLVIFLLQSFSNSPEMMINKQITLPRAATGVVASDAPVIAISREMVNLDKQDLGDTAKMLANPDALIKRLRDLREGWQKSHPQIAFAGDIHLQADQQLPAPLVSQFMSLLISQGYSSIHLAVISGSK